MGNKIENVILGGWSDDLSLAELEAVAGGMMGCWDVYGNFTFDCRHPYGHGNSYGG